MKKSLLLLALCAFAGQLAAADMPAVCKKYKKAAYESIDKIAKFAKARGKEDYDVAGAKKDFDKDYAELKGLSKQEQETACKAGLTEVKEVEAALQMLKTAQ